MLELPQVPAAIPSITETTTQTIINQEVIEYVSPVVIFWTSPALWAGMRLIETLSLAEWGDFEAEATAGATITSAWVPSGAFPLADPPIVTIVDNLATVEFQLYDDGGIQFWSPGQLTLTAAKDGLTHTAILQMADPY